MNQTVLLFSPIFHGNMEAWEFSCDRSNRRNSLPIPYLNNDQLLYALMVGYITTHEFNERQIKEIA